MEIRDRLDMAKMREIVRRPHRVSKGRCMNNTGKFGESSQDRGK